MTDPLPTILDTLAGEAGLRRPTGGFGHLAILPAGWANITIHRKNRSRLDDDTATEYHGPILRRTDEFVCIEVHGEPMSGVFITEGAA